MKDTSGEWLIEWRKGNNHGSTSFPSWYVAYAAGYAAGQRAASEEECGCESCANWERVANQYQALLSDVERQLNTQRGERDEEENN